MCCYLFTFVCYARALRTLCNLLEASSIKQMMRSGTTQPNLLPTDSLVVGCLTAEISKMRIKQVMTTHLG